MPLITQFQNIQSKRVTELKKKVESFASTCVKVECFSSTEGTYIHTYLVPTNCNIYKTFRSRNCIDTTGIHSTPCPEVGILSKCS